tara:strand:+ start:1255 stop:1602 length:348 start_codon:yes stop_codon:yes gene_type:complete
MLSIGTDIVKIDRIRDLSKDDKFLNKIFSDKELQYCDMHSDPAIHLSGKYAAKEAVKKALLSSNLIDHISIKSIEVLNNTDKSPYIHISTVKDVKYKVSISHDGNYAIAFVIIER